MQRASMAHAEGTPGFAILLSGCLIQSIDRPRRRTTQGSPTPVPPPSQLPQGCNRPWQGVVRLHIDLQARPRRSLLPPCTHTNCTLPPPTHAGSFHLVVTGPTDRHPSPLQCLQRGVCSARCHVPSCAASPATAWWVSAAKPRRATPSAVPCRGLFIHSLLPSDLQDCREPAADIQPTTTSAAIARQQPPPKSLLVCLTGALQGPGASSLEEADVPHLDALVAGGWAGLLACRAGGPSLVQQLLGLVCEGQAPPQSLADRCEDGRVAASRPGMAEASRSKGVCTGCPGQQLSIAARIGTLERCA